MTIVVKSIFWLFDPPLNVRPSWYTLWTSHTLHSLRSTRPSKKEVLGETGECLFRILLVILHGSQYLLSPSFVVGAFSLFMVMGIVGGDRGTVLFSELDILLFIVMTGIPWPIKILGIWCPLRRILNFRLGRINFYISNFYISTYKI